LAAIAGLSLAAMLAFAGLTVTGCGSSSSNTQPSMEAGSDVVGANDSGPDVEDSGLTDTTVPMDVMMMPETTPPADGGDAALPTLAAPTFTPPTNTNNPGTVTIAVAGLPANGFIYYTTNGTMPNQNSPIYVGPIQVTMGETIFAYAHAPGYQDSPFAHATYTVSVVMPEGGTEAGVNLTPPTFVPTSSKQFNDFKVALTTSTPGATICYTLDNTTPTCTNGSCTGSSLSYNSVTQVPISGSTNTPGQAAGITIVNAITCEAGATNSSEASQTYQLQVADPTMSSPAPGTILVGSTPIVSSTTTGAVIAYSTSAGTVPTCINGTGGVGTTVTNPHTFGAPGNSPADPLKAATYQTIGCKAGYAPSNVSTSTYVLKLNTPGLQPSGTQHGPGTYDDTLTAGNFIDKNAGVANEWDCYTTDGTAPACGTTQSACGANEPAGIGPTGSAGSITKTGTVVTVVSCALGYTQSAAATGTYTLQLDPPDLTPPGTDTNGAPVKTYAIPANMVGSFTATGGQAGGGHAYDYMCVNKGAAPACGTAACNAGAKINIGNTVPPTGIFSTNFIAPGDSWSVIGCVNDNSFLPSVVTTVSYSGPGVASAPQIFPAAGPSTVQVQPFILNTDTTAGTSICYTEDGSAPSCTGGGTTTCTAVPASGTGTVPTGTGSTLVTNGGSGYVSAPSVTFSGGGATTQATATAVLYVDNITLTSGGSGYTGAPLVVITDPTNGGIGNITCARAFITGGAVTSITLDTTSAGCRKGALALDGYTTPTVQIVGGGATTAATATATGSVEQLTVTTGGAGYITPPTVTITGSGTGATALAITTNVVIAGSTLQTNTTNSTITALACNAGETSPAAVSSTYTFNMAEPDFTSANGSKVGDLNTATSITSGEAITVSTGSNFAGQSIAITTGSTAVNCGSGIPAGATLNSDGSVTINVPTNVATFTLNAIACGMSTTTQNTSAVRTTTFSTITTGAPNLTTDQTVPSGLTGCQPAQSGSCAPQGTWFNTFDVFLASTTSDAQICYTTNNSAPSCGAGGSCMNGTPYNGGGGTGSFAITQSNTPVQAIACSATTGASGIVSQKFVLEVSPADFPATAPTCNGTVTLTFDNTNPTKAEGGVTAGAVICYTLDGSPPGCTTSGATVCGTANNPVTTTAVTGASTKVTWTTCETNFTPNTGNTTYTESPYRHAGAIALDGVLGDWNTAEPTTAGEGDPTNAGHEALFTYDASTLYFALTGLPAASSNDYVVVYVGDAVAAGAAPSIPTPFGGTGGVSLGSNEGIQYEIQWQIGASTAAVYAWNNGALAWQAAASITASVGYSIPNNTVELSVPIASLTQLGTLSYVTVVQSVVSGAGTATPTQVDWVTGAAVGPALQHGYYDNYASCLTPNEQLF
jgi:hypothetical protein